MRRRSRGPSSAPPPHKGNNIGTQQRSRPPSGDRLLRRGDYLGTVWSNRDFPVLDTTRPPTQRDSGCVICWSSNTLTVFPPLHRGFQAANARRVTEGSAPSSGFPGASERTRGGSRTPASVDRSPRRVPQGPPGTTRPIGRSQMWEGADTRTRFHRPELEGGPLLLPGEAPELGSPSRSGRDTPRRSPLPYAGRRRGPPSAERRPPKQPRGSRPLVE